MQEKAKKGEYLDILLRLKNTVFSTKQIALIWYDSNTNLTKVRRSEERRVGKEC